MTSEEILKDKEMEIPDDATDQSYWLREIAYQLAMMNERNERRDNAPAAYAKWLLGIKEEEESHA